jgi:hypothetical protein
VNMIEPQVVPAEELGARADRGAALLDKEKPGWADKINLETFDITECHYCVLGQVYGNFFTSPLREKLIGPRPYDTAEVEAHGFDLTAEEYQHDGNVESLGAAWVHLIRARQA